MTTTAFEEVCALATAYCHAVWDADADAFEAMLHARFNMTHVGPDGLTYWDKNSFVARVRARDAFAGGASFGIDGVDIAGAEMARVHLWVDVPPLRYEDHLGFVKEDGRWQLLTKVFRTQARLDAQEV